MRITLAIRSVPAENKWTIHAAGPSIAWDRDMLQQADQNKNLLPFPNRAPGEPEPEGLAAQPVAEVARVYAEIADRKPASIKEYGRYLFDNLLGSVRWNELLE